MDNYRDPFAINEKTEMLFVVCKCKIAFCCVTVYFGLELFIRNSSYLSPYVWHWTGFHYRSPFCWFVKTT